MTTQVQHQLMSQGHLNQPTYESITNTHFCKEYLRSILEISSSSSSKYEPSHLNYKAPSSRNSFLPQGSLNNVILSPYASTKKIRRISSSSLKPSSIEGGCISLLNYYWRYNTSFSKEESLLGVQIYIFHLLGDNKVQLDVNLNILLHSTQDNVLQRPVVIVLSSFLPRRFYLSVLSYLSRTQHPIHILMTNANNDIIFTDRGLRDSDIDRIFISVLDKSYNKLFTFRNSNNWNGLDKNIEEIRLKVTLSDFYKFGNFSGFRFNSISSTSSGVLWLFGNGVQYSTKKPIMKLVAIEVLEKNLDNINVILGKEDDLKLPEHDVFFNEICIIVQGNNFEALSDRIYAFKKFIFRIDESRTCSYLISESSKLSKPLDQEYKTISWIHFENMSNMTLKLSSERLSQNNETHLVILTAKDIGSSKIIIDSFLLNKKVHILTNISLDSFNEPNFHDSLLISLRPMVTKSASEVTKSHSIVNYIGRSSSAVMQTTIYKLKSSMTYEIQVNVDDSQLYSFKDVIINSTCWCHKGVNISLSLDLRIWKVINNWIPSEFRFENQSITLKVKDDFVTFKNPTAECSNDARLKKNRIYGIWHNYKYMLNLPFTFNCLERNKNVQIEPKIKDNGPRIKSTEEPPIILKTGHVYNDSRFINMLREPLYNKDRLYIQITQSIVNEISLKKGIQLRDCYVTNQMTSEKDLNDLYETNKFLKKIKVIQNGCINHTSPFYSDMDEDLRPYNHSELRGAMYRFSVGVDADKWASLLSLRHIWLLHGRLEVHLFCGINHCKILQEGSLKTPEDCRPEKACFTNMSSSQIFQYFGILTILRNKKENNMTLKMSILVLLNILIITSLFALIQFLRRLYKFRFRYKCSPSLSIREDDWRSSDIRIQGKDNKKLRSKIDYCSLKLLGGVQQSSAKLYCSPSCSLQQLIVDTDRSIHLQAGYLLSPSDKSTLNDHCVFVDTECNSRLLSHSVSELCLSHNVPVVIDKALYSWPLSAADRHRRSHHSQPPPPHHHSFRSSTKRDCYRLTLSNKLKVSLTFTSGPKSFSYTSNPKLSSNRTTVSGAESASAISDMPKNKSHRWWSHLSNCSINNTAKISRN